MNEKKVEEGMIHLGNCWDKNDKEEMSSSLRGDILQGESRVANSISKLLRMRQLLGCC